MEDSPRSDVFIGHHSDDVEAVSGFARRLTALGLTFSTDLDPQPQPPSISERIARIGMGIKLFLVWMSPRYCNDAACQRQFMALLATCTADRDSPSRLLLLNTLPASEPLPAMLLERCSIESPLENPEASAHRIATRVRGHCVPVCAQLAVPTIGRITAGREFTGRIGDLWRIHEAFARQQGPQCIVALWGEAGAGKTWLAEEYASAFAAAYPGGVYTLDAGWYAHAAPHELELMREHAWRCIAATLEIDIDAIDAGQIAMRVRRHLEARALPYLWIVDHLPTHQTPDAIRRWLAPSANGCSILISRTEQYTALGDPIFVGGLDMRDACALLAHHKPAPTEQERIALRQLVAHLGHHSLSVHLAAARIARSSYDRFLLQLAAPAKEAAILADELSESMTSPQLVGIAVTLGRSIAHLGAQARTALRIAAVLADAPVPTALVTTALAQHPNATGGHSAVAQTQLAIDELIASALAYKWGDEFLCVPPLVRAAVLAAENSHDIALARAAIVTILAGELPQAPEANRHNPYLAWLPHVLHLSRQTGASTHLLEINAWLARFDSLGVLRSGNRRAIALLEHGDMAHAQELLDMEVAARKLGLGEDHPGTVTPENNLAVVLTLRGEFTRARSLLEHSVAVRRKTLGETHPDTLTPLNNLGVILWHEGDIDAARVLFERVVELRQHALGDSHPDTLVAMRNLAVALRHSGEYVAARSLLEHVVETRRAALGNQHVDTRTAMAGLAQTLREQSEAILVHMTPPREMDAPRVGHASIRTLEA